MSQKLRLSPLALGGALGIFWGLVVFIMALLIHFFAFSQMQFTSAGVIYVTYNATILGAFIGGAISFLEAFVVGVIISWLYNGLLCCCKHKCCPKKEEKEEKSE